MFPRKCLVACFLFASVFLVAENKQKSYDTARQHASELMDISSGPLQIRGTFHANMLAGGLDGQYEYIQLSKDQHREVITSPGFTQYSIYNRGRRYVFRSTSIEPLPISRLLSLIWMSWSAPLKLEVSRVNSLTENGRKLKCYEMEKSAFGPTEYGGVRVCFAEDTGAVASTQWSYNTDLYKMEYFDFRDTDHKLFPTRMERLDNGRVSVEVQINSVSHDAQPEKVLDPPEGASYVEDCKKFFPAEPEYSSEYYQIRSRFNSGSVVLAGAVDHHGHKSQIEIQQTGGSKLDEAALEALKHLYLQPARCDGRSIPSSFRFQIWFSPAMHPDLFTSFRW